MTEGFASRLDAVLARAETCSRFAALHESGVRAGLIVAAERDDETAEELLSGWDEFEDSPRDTFIAAPAAALPMAGTERAWARRLVGSGEAERFVRAALVDLLAYPPLARPRPGIAPVVISVLVAALAGSVDALAGTRHAARTCGCGPCSTLDREVP